MEEKGDTYELEKLVDEESETECEQPPSDCCKCTCPYIGLLLATLSSLFFSLCSVIVKRMKEIDPMALAAYRYVGVMLPAIPIMLYKRESVFPKGKCFTMFLRSSAGTASLVFSFYAFRHMPLADASVIVFSVPVFTTIFAWIFLKEPCGIFNVISVFVTLVGAILVTRPTYIFRNTVTSLGHNLKGSSEMWGIMAAFASTFFGASSYVLLRALKGVHFSVTLTNFGTFAAIVCFIFSYFMDALHIPIENFDRLLILALAIFSFCGQILLTMALQIEQAGPVSIARSSDIVFAFIWQMLFFGEIPNMYSIIGAILVMTSVVIIGLRKWVMSLPEYSSFKQSLTFLTK